MVVETIDKSTWNRRDIYEMFSREREPFYEITFPVDVTNLKTYVKKHKLSFHFSCVYLAIQAINEVDAFLLKIHGDEIVRLDKLHPGSTDSDANSDVFHYVTLYVNGTMEEYCRRVKETADMTGFFRGDPCAQEEMVFFTVLPWISFTGLRNVPPSHRDDSIPRVSFGKYTCTDGKLMMPCAVLANHRLVDGQHVGQFYEKFQKKIDELA